MTTSADEKLKAFSNLFNRNYGQTVLLFELCGFSYDKLLALEFKIKSLFMSSCPSSKEQVEKVLSMPDKSLWFYDKLFKENP